MMKRKKAKMKNEKEKVDLVFFILPRKESREEGHDSNDNSKAVRGRWP